MPHIMPSTPTIVFTILFPSFFSDLFFTLLNVFHLISLVFHCFFFFRTSSATSVSMDTTAVPFSWLYLCFGYMFQFFQSLFHSCLAVSPHHSFDCHCLRHILFSFRCLPLRKGNFIFYLMISVRIFHFKRFRRRALILRRNSTDLHRQCSEHRVQCPSEDRGSTYRPPAEYR